MSGSEGKRKSGGERKRKSDREEKNKYNINEFQKNKIEEFMDKYNEDDKMVMLDLMERTELMLLNNS
tara:strand:- start:232 stop:432 length:201 start_codon:yes stop_codon:yes gene_type:complete